MRVAVAQTLRNRCKFPRPNLNLDRKRRFSRWSGRSSRLHVKSSVPPGNCRGFSWHLSDGVLPHVNSRRTDV